MRQIDRLTSAARQQCILTGIAGEQITMTVRFIPSQRMWVADILWDSFALYGISLVCSLNLLRSYVHIIPFGLMLVTDDNQDPLTLDAFSTGYARLYLLTVDEVAQIENVMFT